MLATQPDSIKLFTEFLADRGPTGETQIDEMASMEAAVKAVSVPGKPGQPDVLKNPGQTIFHRDDKGNLVLYDYVFKGHAKDSITAMNRMEAEERNGIKDKLQAHKSKIDGCVFVFPRQIILRLPAGTTVGTKERPAVVSTAQGQRIALLKSETVPAGTTLDVTYKIMSKEMVSWVIAVLDYGAFRGLGAWRNASWGRFSWERLDAEGGKVIEKA
jgi:hypothetical protein